MRLLGTVTLIASVIGFASVMTFLASARSSLGEKTVSGVQDVSSEHFCFPPQERQDFAGIFTPRRRLRLEISGWQSHRVVTRMAEILLREKLGYDVRVLNFTIEANTAPQCPLSPVHGGNRSTGECRFLRLRDDVVDMNLELWPQSIGSEAVQTEVQALTYVAASSLGSIGYLGRSGWFIPRSSLRDVAAGPLGDAPYRALMPLLASVQQTLANHTRLPTPDSTCAQRPNLDVGFGSYDCAGGEWTFPGAGCCSRAAAAAGTCAANLPPCALLHIESLAYDFGRNEGALAGSGLQLQIQYGPLQERMEIAQREALPLLF